MTTHRLPRRIQRLIDLIGWSQTLRLLNARGGTAVYFPRDPANARTLAYVVSPEALEVLCKEFGGRESAVRLPKPDKMLLRQRNAQIVAEFRAGVSPASLAASYGLTDRMIQNIVKDGRETYIYSSLVLDS